MDKMNHNIIKNKGDSAMKKTALFVIAMTFIFSTAMINSAKAETQGSEIKTAPTGETKVGKPVMTGQPMVIGNPMMGGKHMDTEGSKAADMLMRYVMGKQIVATSDGGIVIAIGNKLYKYDSSLNFQKEVDIPLDLEGLKKMTMDIKDFGMMEDKKKKENDSTSKGTDETKKKE
jgi:hypothetical protein